MIVKNSEFIITQGDMLGLEVEAIVNAANKYLSHGGGLARQIVIRGGKIITEESRKLAPINTGDAVITSAGKLPQKYVIHAVGPVYGSGNEEEKLRKAVYNSLKLANEKGITSIAFPAISTGIFGYPTEKCASVMIKTIYDFLQNENRTLNKVIICLYEDFKYQMFKNEFVRRSSLWLKRYKK